LIDRYITSKSTKNRELQNLAESKKPICQKHKQNPNNTEKEEEEELTKHQSKLNRTN
jgi:predicted outer membrane protein